MAEQHADQRYLIWKDCNEHSEAWKAEQQRIQDEANRKRAEAAKEQPRTESGFAEKQVVPQLVAAPEPNRSSTAKAVASKSNRGAVERMDMLSRERPDLAAKVKKGEIPAAAAKGNDNAVKDRETVVAQVVQPVIKTAVTREAQHGY